MAIRPLSVATALALNFVIIMESLEQSCAFGPLNENDSHMDGL